MGSALAKTLGLTKFWIQCSREHQDYAIHALSHALNVDPDTIEYERGVVWTEVGFDSPDEAREYLDLAKNSLRKYIKNYSKHDLEDFELKHKIY